MNCESSFDDSIAHEGQQIKIRSVCKKCGEARVVSVLDGTLEAWKDGHNCDPETAGRRRSFHRLIREKSFPAPLQGTTPDGCVIVRTRLGSCFGSCFVSQSGMSRLRAPHHILHAPKISEYGAISLFELVEQRCVRKQFGHVADPVPDNENFYACPRCGQLVEKDNVEQVLHHSLPVHQPIPTE